MTSKSPDIISKKTRYEFREVLAHRILRQIEMEFDAADIELSDQSPTVSGQRRSLVEQYQSSLDYSNWKDVRKILKVYENVLDSLKEVGTPLHSYNEEGASKARSDLLKWLAKDGFHLNEEGRLVSKAVGTHVPELSEIASTFDSHELQKQIERVKSAVEDDPGLAIGTAKEILETTCKTILLERKIKVDENWDVIELLKHTRKILKLVPDSVPTAAKGAETIKRLLSNLGQVAQGLGELRNLYGTGHGRVNKAKGITARHARLAVGASTTLAVFLFETHSEVE